MTRFKNLAIEALNNIHDRANFQCGTEALDAYLKKQARQDIRRNTSRVFVATMPDAPTKIIGYYTLSSLSIDLRQLPEALVRSLPKHHLPAALVGRLAVSQVAQGYGVGTMLLSDAIKRTLAVSDNIAIYAIVVDAISKDAQRFYEQFGFSQLGADGPRLFLPLQSVQ